jgi:predicted metalloprotease
LGEEGGIRGADGECQRQMRGDRGFGESLNGGGPHRRAGRGGGQPGPAGVIVVLATPMLEVDPVPVSGTDEMSVLVGLQTRQAGPARERGREEEH